MPTDQSTDDAATAVNEFKPLPATTHLVEVVRDTSVLPERGRTDWPLEPWRFVLVATAVMLAIPCGIAAAAPVWNGADLAVLICLAIFVAAFAIPSPRRKD